MSSSSILFQNSDKSVILLDLPRSIEEAQVPSAHLTNVDPPKLPRLVSAPPPSGPFPTPEPKTQNQLPTTSAASQIATLMTLSAAESALTEIRNFHTGPLYLSRIYTPSPSPPNNPNPPPSPYIVPPSTPYLSGTISSQRELFLLTAPPKFNLILIDPPWPNRSAKRKRTGTGYHTVRDYNSIHDLLSLIPVASRLAPDGLVGVWITNSAQAAEVLTAPTGGLFVQWDVEAVGEWIWLKVTTEGEPVVSLDSEWRKPWERLVIGRKRGGKKGGSVESKVIVTVPDVHSRKPNLRRLFEEVEGLVPGEYEALEVFARNLTSGWWAWGDEVLLFQRREHWREADEGVVPEESDCAVASVSSGLTEPGL
ncbi:MT-A70-domain-containing protein [Podospora aff. communis PSN243]|uniref:MT-A70-domain-containing protein n=1 Tax=Podospora aff. communis PSN243 TaxID=3040156 RepID=A0AAV9GRE3_9PEZI|nr:MT-A70-domain-containing protein [Podospora aff. communis PSN243]